MAGFGGKMSGPSLVPTQREATGVWAKIGLLSFGGPAAQIALMHRMVVEEKGWLNERQFLSALSFCMLLPGPEAMQLATYTGWKLHGVRGGLIAGLLFVLPGAAVVLALAILYVSYGQLALLQAGFLGVKAAVLVIIFEALLRVARKSLSGLTHWVLAGLSFVALFFFQLPFPLVIALAGLYGFWLGDRNGPRAVSEQPTVAPGRTLRTIVLWLVIWIAPLWVISVFSGTDVFRDLSLFFSKLAVVTFGGAYAVLAYMAQDAVQNQGWLSATEMLDGLGLAETTPGPLILVTEFVGFMGAARADGTVNIWTGVAGAGVTLWATFAPCFLWVFAGAPYIAVLESKPRIRNALSAISAAVVGVILNLSVWFALHVMFGEVQEKAVGPVTLWVAELASLDWRVLVLTTLAAGMLLIARRGVPFTLLMCALVGIGLGSI